VITQLSCDGVTLHNQTDPTRVLVEYPTGLVGTPPARAAAQDRPDDDGSMDATRYYQSRAFDLAGKLRFTTFPALQAAMDGIQQVFLLPPSWFDAQGLNLFAWTLADGSTRQIAARVDSSVDWTWAGNIPTVYWHASFVAPNPRVYSGGSAHSASGAATVTITNAGYATTEPLFTVTGPASFVKILNNNTGAAIQTKTALGLAAGQSLVVDSSARSVVMAGTVRPDIVDWPNSEWPIARNGSNQYVLTTTGGTARRR
jgi:hypothetical protein